MRDADFVRRVMLIRSQIIIECLVQATPPLAARTLRYLSNRPFSYKKEGMTLNI